MTSSDLFSCTYNVETSDPASTEERANLVSESISMTEHVFRKRASRTKGKGSLVLSR
jgi:hypothetical protein